MSITTSSFVTFPVFRSAFFVSLSISSWVITFGLAFGVDCKTLRVDALRTLAISLVHKTIPLSFLMQFYHVSPLYHCYLIRLFVLMFTGKFTNTRNFLAVACLELLFVSDKYQTVTFFLSKVHLCSQEGHKSSCTFRSAFHFGLFFDGIMI